MRESDRADLKQIVAHMAEDGDGIIPGIKADDVDEFLNTIMEVDENFMVSVAQRAIDLGKQEMQEPLTEPQTGVPIRGH